MERKPQLCGTLLVSVLILLFYLPVWATEGTERRWERGQQILRNFICQTHGVSTLTIASVVTLIHPEEPGYQVPPEEGQTILIRCDYIEFLEGSRLESVSNLRIHVESALSGIVHVKSVRGKPGLDAAPDRELAKSSKAENGAKGAKGKKGRNASTWRWRSSDRRANPGRPGGDGGDGKAGLPGDQGPAGSPGHGGSTIHITAFSVDSETTVTIESIGGPGGNGGRGGRGQDGGDGGDGGRGGKGGNAASLNSAKRGGNGGNGGDGGDGGDGGTGGTGARGGDGGEIYLYLVEDDELPYFHLMNEGGAGGDPGIGGHPGKGGEGGAMGHAGGGGWPAGPDPLCLLTLCTHRILFGSDLEVKWHGEGDSGNRGSYGATGQDGRPGRIGKWGERGDKGKEEIRRWGLVPLEDFISHGNLLEGS